MSPTTNARTASPRLAAFLHLLAFFCGALTLATACSGAPASAAERVVLPGAVTPDRYRIAFTPDAAALAFKGSVAIDVTVHAPTRRVVLNCADLVIDHATLSGTQAAARVSYDAREQTATLDFGKELPPGAATLLLDYHGKIYLQASGLFAVDYARTPSGGSGCSSSGPSNRSCNKTRATARTRSSRRSSTCSRRAAHSTASPTTRVRP